MTMQYTADLIFSDRVAVSEPLYCLWNSQPRIHGIDVVILARDEATIIGNTLEALNRILGPHDRIHLVADSCLDETALIARRNDAIVYIRSEKSPSGKGPALRWWLEQTRKDAEPDDIIVVLDADTQVAPDFLKCLRKRMCSGASVVQARVAPLLHSKTPVARLAAFSEIVEQRVKDKFRTRFGWPVRLRGTGMAFRREVLEAVSDSLHTLVEDVELTILLAERGIPIVFADETYVSDPKPDSQDGAVQQRARWLKGQYQILRFYPKTIMSLIRRGLPGWSLLSSVLLKPATLLLTIRAVIVACAWISIVLWGGWLWNLIAILGSLSLLFEGGLFLYGLRYVPDPKDTLCALVLAPAYLIMWLKSLALSAVSGNTWLRSRKTMSDPSPVGRKYFLPLNAAGDIIRTYRSEVNLPVIVPASMTDGTD